MFTSSLIAGYLMIKSFFFPYYLNSLASAIGFHKIVSKLFENKRYIKAVMSKKTSILEGWLNIQGRFIFPYSQRKREEVGKGRKTWDRQTDEWMTERDD